LGGNGKEKKGSKKERVAKGNKSDESKTKKTGGLKRIGKARGKCLVEEQVGFWGVTSQVL